MSKLINVIRTSNSAQIPCTMPASGLHITYWDIRGLCQPIRLALAYAKVEMNDYESALEEVNKSIKIDNKKLGEHFSFQNKDRDKEAGYIECKALKIKCGLKLFVTDIKSLSGSHIFTL